MTNKFENQEQKHNLNEVYYDSNKDLLKTSNKKKKNKNNNIGFNT